MMRLSWREYILSHKDREAYDEGADLIQSIIDPKSNAETSFLHLSEHPTLVVLSRSSLNKEIQLSFFHSIRKSSLLAKNYSHFALIGMGHQACAMKIDPKEIFRLTPKRRVPSFNALMNCSSKEQVKSLCPVQSMIEEKLESHALIPPLLLEEIVKLESLDAQDVLLTCIQKIRTLKPKDHVEIQIAQDTTDLSSPTASEESTWEEFTESDLANMRVSEEEEKRSSARIKGKQRKNDNRDESGKDPLPEIVTQPKEDEGFDDDNRSFERRFARILLFLWSIIHEDSSIKPVHIAICSRASTLEWLDSTHDKCLGPSAPLPPQPQSILPPPFPMQMGTNLGLDHAAVAMTKLSDAWGKKIELEVQEKEERDKKKKEKAFEKLSEVQQRTLILITATTKDSDDTVPDMKPTEDMKKVPEQTVGIKVQAQLQYEFKSKGHMVDIGLAFATQLKNGCITSQPSVHDINGLSPFFLPHQAADERLNQDLALRLEEQLSFGKINESDLKMITKCKIHFPKNFGEYDHFIQNFIRMVIIIAGERSIFAERLQELRQHAREHERCYRELEQEHYFLYASILEHMHKRCQHYIHSAGAGLVSKLKKRKLRFEAILEEIEDGDYVPTKPKWLKDESPKTNGLSPRGQRKRESPGGDRGQVDMDSPKPKKKSFDNPSFDPDLKCPSGFQYRQVFHPNNRRGIDEVKHDDGTTRCNNWFFRGWCTEGCTFKESHKKPLNPTEKEKCKEYLNKLVQKQKKWHEGRNRNQTEG